jgi:cytochrome c biogenesis protein CcmG/thiol:disulfide interchange protein DsbE
MIINFFASWCVPCVAEAPVLADMKRKGAPIVGIAVRDRPMDVAAFLARHGNPYQAVGADPQSQVQIALGSSGVPESFVVDGRGIVRYQHIGPIEPDDVPAILAKLEAAK